MTPGRHRAVAIAAAAVVLASCGTAVATSDDQTAARAQRTGPIADTSDRAPSSAAPAVKRYRSVRTHRTVARPVAVRVPSIGVSSDLQRLGRTRAGTIAVPDDWHEAGWYREGPKPGQVGPAVILGHVDSRSGPAIFHRLRELDDGDEVHVDRADGTTVTFVVERSERHAKTRFPTHDVYLPTLRPTLRLVTCGGPFDAGVGHYRDNIVVFARLAE